ncbi:hypothetical protein [Paenibacillus odorifer]|uniref:hypothetical protein n=1 Tax=Paenibacillus odorifer TaxID=189426 RepID=UPI00096F5B81|nr:hypothetical protein [Paenibacillus odorifer]OME12780.1 hypothetical protein BSK60_16895 [Paenibacillus odorifer]
MGKFVPRPIPEIAQPLPGIQEPISIRQWLGLNTFDPLNISDSQFTDMSNMTTDDYPAATVRPGYSVLGSAIGGKVLGVAVWKDIELHSWFGDGTWRKWTGSTWTTLKSGLSTTAMWSWTSFQGNLDDINLVAANGVDGLHRYDGSTVQTFSDAPTNINFITTYQNRLWGGSGKELHASALDQPEAWNIFGGTGEDSFVKDMESIRGESINSLSGSLSKLVIGMPNSIHELYGALPSEFTVRLITEKEGTANNRAAVVQESTMRFAHQTGIFEYLSGGMYPDKTFSEIIDKFTTNINSNAVMGSDNDKTYCYDGSSRILVYDARNGVQSWLSWSGYTPTCYTIFQHDLYVGDATGRVLKLDNSQNDAGAPISWYLVTKAFTNPVMSQRQRWLKMWLYAEIPVGTTINIYLSTTKDGNDFNLVHTVVGTGTKVERVIIPVRSVVLENTVRVKISGTGPAKIHELVRQVRQLPLF